MPAALRCTTAACRAQATFLEASQCLACDEEGRTVAKLCGHTINMSPPKFAADLAEAKSSSSASRRCVCCLEEREVGITCDADHFMHSSCLQQYALARVQKLREMNALAFEADAAPPASIPTFEGRVLCPVPGCQAPALSDVEIARHLSDSAFEKYLEGRSLLSIARAKQTVHEEVQQALDTAASSSSSSTVAARMRESDESLMACWMRNAFPNARMCGRCFFGPVDLTGCDDLVGHHGLELEPGGAKVDNRCPRCHWFAPVTSSWPAWDGIAAKASALKSIGDSIEAWRLQPNAPGAVGHFLDPGAEFWGDEGDGFVNRLLNPAPRCHECSVGGSTSCDGLCFDPEWLDYYQAHPATGGGCSRCGCSREWDEDGERVCWCATCADGLGCELDAYTDGRTRAPCERCGCEQEEDEYGDRLCFCDACHSAGCVGRHADRRRAPEHQDPLWRLPPTAPGAFIPRTLMHTGPSACTELADEGFRARFAQANPGGCNLCGCSREVDEDGERVCFCDLCQLNGGCQPPTPLSARVERPRALSISQHIQVCKDTMERVEARRRQASSEARLDAEARMEAWIEALQGASWMEALRARLSEGRSWSTWVEEEEENSPAVEKWLHSCKAAAEMAGAAV